MRALVFAAFLAGCADSADSGPASGRPSASEWAYDQITVAIDDPAEPGTLYGVGPVYVVMYCPGGDLGICYPAQRGPDYTYRGGVLSLTATAGGDVFVVGYYAEAG